MKRMRMFALLTALALAAFAPSAAAEYDFSALTLEELYEARARLDEAIREAEAAVGVQLYESGVYEVGADLPAGDYLLTENPDAMFASVIVREGDSEEAGLMTYHLINRQLIIRFTAGTWVTLTEACARPVAQAASQEADAAGEGGYLVGTTLPAGRYVATAIEKAPLSSYSIYDGILDTGSQLTKFEVLREPVTVELSEGEYIELSGCTLTAADAE